MNKTFAILGYPLGHTMSPPIHKRLFALSGNPANYLTWEVAPGQWGQNIPMLKALSGFNVTIPHKTDLLQYMDRFDDTASRYGALNVVAVEAGAHVGYNTDCYGFRKTVEMLGADLGLPVCVLGAGGVGRMFAIESSLCGAPVTLAVRESGIPLAQQVQCDIRRQNPHAQVRIVDIERLDAQSKAYDLLINATPAGMYPHTDGIAVNPAFLPRCTYVFDSVYNPTVTTLLRKAAEAGCKTCGGMAMLVWQAVRAHEIWDGAVYQTESILALIAEMCARVDKNFN